MNRFKNRINDSLKLLGYDQQRFAKQNSLNTFIVIAIFGKYYKCNICYQKLDKYWVK